MMLLPLWHSVCLFTVHPLIFYYSVSHPSLKHSYVYLFLCFNTPIWCDQITVPQNRSPLTEANCSMPQTNHIAFQDPNVIWLKLSIDGWELRQTFSCLPWIETHILRKSLSTHSLYTTQLLFFNFYFNFPQRIGNTHIRCNSNSKQYNNLKCNSELGKQKLFEFVNFFRHFFLGEDKILGSGALSILCSPFYNNSDKHFDFDVFSRNKFSVSSIVKG